MTKKLFRRPTTPKMLSSSDVGHILQEPLPDACIDMINLVFSVHAILPTLSVQHLGDKVSQADRHDQLMNEIDEYTMDDRHHSMRKHVVIDEHRQFYLRMSVARDGTQPMANIQVRPKCWQPQAANGLATIDEVHSILEDVWTTLEQYVDLAFGPLDKRVTVTRLDVARDLCPVTNQQQILHAMAATPLHGSQTKTTYLDPHSSALTGVALGSKRAGRLSGYNKFNEDPSVAPGTFRFEHQAYRGHLRAAKINSPLDLTPARLNSVFRTSLDHTIAALVDTPAIRLERVMTALTPPDLTLLTGWLVLREHGLKPELSTAAAKRMRDYARRFDLATINDLLQPDRTNRPRRAIPGHNTGTT